jgi:MoxR-like ATPase
MATQNPIEQEGTYPLPEAQLDRFLLHVRIDYPDIKSEHKILQIARAQARENKLPVVDRKSQLSQNLVFTGRQEVLQLHLSPALEAYIVQLISATRAAGRYNPHLAHWISYGASPRATIALDRCARAHAWLHGRNYVSPEDIHAVAPDILRHRLVLSFEAEADGVNADRVIQELLAKVPVP